ncbi:acyltransferase [Sulfitobacter pontiacus]|uniref:acyltransferase n=1 Tax=Sulfitobacter pontiacus TaxID=60137 RepID=UPI0030EB924B
MLVILRRLWLGLRRRLRNFYYAQILGSIGRNCQICEAVVIADPQNVFLGAHVSVNDQAILQSCEGADLVVEDYVTISYGAKILTGGLDRSSAIQRSKQHVSRSIILRQSCWIGAGAIVLPGVSVGEGATVAAGSVVTKDVAPGTVVAGIPARAVKQLSRGVNG